MPLIAVTVAVDRLAVRQSQVPLCAFQRLNRRLLVYRQHQRVLRRVQVQTHHVRSLRTELRIRADAPTPFALEANVVPPQNPPDLSLAHIAQRFGKPAPVPLRIPLRGPLVKQAQNALFRGLVVMRRLPRPRRIGQPRDPVLSETPTPFGYTRRSRVQLFRYLLVAPALMREQHDPGPLRQPALRLASPEPLVQNLLLFIGYLHRSRGPSHSPIPARYCY